MFKLKKIQKNRGMTYVELIVVLSIVALLSSVSLFNYQLFQEKINMKTLANDIALKITEAQKSSISGKLPILGAPSNWRPSYGVYFDLSVSNKTFYYFADLNPFPGPNKRLDSISPCPGAECIEIINITKNNKIDSIELYRNNIPTIHSTPLHITFTRPNSGADFYQTIGALNPPVDYVQINLSSASGNTKVKIKVFPSGRVQIF